MPFATRPVLRTALLLVPLLAAACGKKDVPSIPEAISGSCTYKNNFSGGPECRDYHGVWTDAAMKADCDGWSGTFTTGVACQIDGKTLGACILEKNGLYIAANVMDTDPGKCGSSVTGCEVFGGGAFAPSTICGGVMHYVDADGGTGGGLPVFEQPIRTCKAPLPGEPPGHSSDGQVCTWEMISGATEEGRHFEDYASCDRVRTQRPYYKVAANPGNLKVDPRLSDPTYATELAWVKDQIRATACVCCHSTMAPKGTANWYVDQDQNFMNGFTNRGLAEGAGWIDSVALGAYPAADNNGFSRATPDDPGHSIFVTTDDARMRRFFAQEVASRGLSQADFAGEDPVGGPLVDQLHYKPTACTHGEGVQQDGTVVWQGGGARYLYVLAKDATTPTVPPNLDLPTGTLWRIDVPEGGAPFASGTVRYGVTPAMLSQKFPSDGSAPPVLVQGQTYYLYVLADLIQPVTRCLFTAP